MGEHVSLDMDRLAMASVTESSTPTPVPSVNSPQSTQSVQSTQFSEILEHSIVTNTSQQGESASFQDKIPAGFSSGATESCTAVCLDRVLPVETDAFDSADHNIAECRICQEEEDITKLETPCACSGSVKYAHRRCVQRWCNEKGDTTCEICHQPYKSGYTAPGRLQPGSSVTIDLSSEDWGIPGAHPMELRDPRILAMAAAQRHFLEAEYDEYAAVNSSSAACCRSAALILMALLLLRHALAMAAANADEDTSMFLTIFLLRVVGFLLPCYIMAHAMNMLHHRHQRQAAAMAAAEVAILLQGGHAQSMQFSLASGTTPIGDLP